MYYEYYLMYLFLIINPLRRKNWKNYGNFVSFIWTYPSFLKTEMWRQLFFFFILFKRFVERFCLVLPPWSVNKIIIKFQYTNAARGHCCRKIEQLCFREIVVCDRHYVPLMNKVQSKKKSICDISEFRRHTNGPSLPEPAIVSII